MGFSIPLTGLAANDPVPGNYLEINFAQGAASLGTATYAAILIGNRTTTGSAVVDTTVYGPTSAVPMVNETDVIGLFGVGSELHRMWRRFTKVNKTTPLYAIAVTESAGAKATLALTFATTAGANGTLRIWCGDESTDVAVTSGDTISTIAAAAVLAVNAMVNWPVTASNTTVSASNDTCLLTAKQKGLRGNWLRGQAALYSSGTIATTVTNTAVAFFTGGTTADSSTTALATIASARYYYNVSAAEDATQLGALATQMGTLAAPTVGIRQRCVGGSVDTSSNVITVATGINAARAEIVWSQNSDWTPAEHAANATAVYALEEQPLAFLCNFSGYGNSATTQPKWLVPAPRSGTIPSRTTIKSLLNNGVTPIGVNANGSTYLVKRITTRSLTSSVADYRIRDAHKVTVCDRYGDDLLAKFTLQFAQKNIADDPVQGQTGQPTNVVTPRVVKAAVNKLTDDYADLGLVQNPLVIQAATQVIRETSPTTRISCRIPLQTIDILDQIATAEDQVA